MKRKMTLSDTGFRGTTMAEANYFCLARARLLMPERYGCIADQ